VVALLKASYPTIHRHRLSYGYRWRLEGYSQALSSILIFVSSFRAVEGGVDEIPIFFN
jgi:hypothetical protein